MSSLIRAMRSTLSRRGRVLAAALILAALPVASGCGQMPGSISPTLPPLDTRTPIPFVTATRTNPTPTVELTNETATPTPTHTAIPWTPTPDSGTLTAIPRATLTAVAQGTATPAPTAANASATVPATTPEATPVDAP